MDLNWSGAEVSLISLCGGDFDAAIEFRIFQKRERNFSTKKKHVGSVETTVNNLLGAVGSGNSMLISKDGGKRGEIVALQAECCGFTRPSEVLAAAAETKDLSEAKSAVVASKIKTAELAEKDLEKARLNSKARQESELFAKASLVEAQKAAESAKIESLNAAEEAERTRKAGYFGTLKFQFAGKGLANVEVLKLIDKSDPFFVLEKGASEKAGRIHWSAAFISPIVMDDLNPRWEESSVEVHELCSGDLHEPIRVLVFDWEKNGRHRLIGHFETTVHGVISAPKASVKLPLIKGEDITGHISVLYAEIVGFEDQIAAEERAKELARKADEARFFAIGAQRKAEIKSSTAKEAHNASLQFEETFEAATEEAAKAMRMDRGMQRTVTQRLEELDLV
mmetsp:Transcript_46427/g.140599  ORF Transcript_46427/g.140599 Transcript_46427/m.140599 type:complete len:395 (+) Transcript_46427:282-1466(+)